MGVSQVSHQYGTKNTKTDVHYRNDGTKQKCRQILQLTIITLHVNGWCKRLNVSYILVYIVNMIFYQSKHSYHASTWQWLQPYYS